MCTRRSLIVFTSLIAGLMSVVAPAMGQAGRAAPAGRKPNIVLIVADDLGYADLGCHGSREIPTPRIDSLARNGVRLTDGYVSCPVCSPTRAGLLTGRYQQRFGHEFNPGPAQEAAAQFGLPLDEKTLADGLKAAGYKTGMVGKWHLGYTPAYHPMRRGFDEFFGFLGGAHSYLDARADGRNPILRGTETVENVEYLTDAFTREAVAFIDRHAKEPFFLYLPYNAVHGPLQATQKYLDRFESISDPKRRTYAAMLSAMDDGVGAVLEKLRAEGIEDDTLIFFISDNGGPTGHTTARNDPLQGTKGQLWEGGIRVPYIVQWKRRLPGGKIYDQPAISLDILPTALAAAGGERPANIDGVDLMPYLAGRKEGPPHEALYWRQGEQFAIRKGDWKLLKPANGPPSLFNLAEDIGEKNDLALARPEKVKELEADLGRWNSELKEPLWKGRGAKANRRKARQTGQGEESNQPRKARAARRARRNRAAE